MDIDKLYLASYNYNVDELGNITDFEDGLEEGNKGYWQNQLMTNYLALLQDKDTMHITMRSIDNDTDLIKPYAKSIQRQSTNDNSTLPYNFYSLHEQTERKNDYITGKIGIGPFALNVTNHALTSAYNVKFRETEFTRKVDIVDLDKRRDNEDNTISSWLSAFINAHVDIVKDPWVSVLNINAYTYNMTNLLIRTGKGLDGIKFIGQPILKDLAIAYNNAQGQFNRDRNKSLYQITKETQQNVLLKYAGIDPNNKKEANKFLTQLSNFTTDTSESVKAQLVNDVLSGKNKDQLDVYRAWLCLDPYARALSNLVNCTKIDTKKQGKNLIEQYVYLQKYNDLFLRDEKHYDMPEDEYNELANQNIFNISSTDEFIEESYINGKTYSAIDLMNDILDGQILFTNPSYKRAISKVLTTQGISQQNNADLIKAVDDAFVQKIKTIVIKNWAIRNNIRFKDGITNFKSLFYGNKSIANRFNNLIIEINNGNPKYSRLKDNLLIKSLVIEPVKDNIRSSQYYNGIEHPQFVTLFHGLDDDVFSENGVIEAFDDLLHDPDKNIRTLANELVLYSWLTSGEHNGFNKMFKYVPNSWKIESGFVEELESYFTKDFEDLVDDQFIDDIIRNNWDNTQLIRGYTINGKNTKTNLIGYYDQNNMGQPIVVIGANNNEGNLDVAIESTTDEYPRFIRTKNFAEGNKGYGVNSYRLYKHVGNIDNIPVYVLDTQKGGKFGGFEIQEYDRFDGYNFTLDPTLTRITGGYGNLINNVKSIIGAYSTSGTIISPSELFKVQQYNQFDPTQLSSQQQFITENQIESSENAINNNEEELKEHSQSGSNGSIRKDLIVTHSSKLQDLRNAELQHKGVITTRLNTKNHFGNPFSHRNYNGVQKVFSTVREAVEAYEQWLRGTAYQDIEPERRQWIINQINSGNLDNVPLIYYTDKITDSEGEHLYDYDTYPNHAHILLKLINEHHKSTLNVRTEVHTETKSTGIVLNEQQTKAVDGVVNFVKTAFNTNKGNNICVIKGKAGTGKTTIINEILGKLVDEGINPKSVIVGALSGVATNVIANKINTIPISKATIASMLGIKLDESTGKFTKDPRAEVQVGSNKKQIIIIDECSMVNEDIMNLIKTNMRDDTVVIFLGDTGQLPPIRANSNIDSNKLSPTFDIQTQFELTERVRQGEESPILMYTDFFHNYANGIIKDYPSSIDEHTRSLVNPNGALIFGNYENINRAVKLFRKSFNDMNPNLVKIVAYTNRAVAVWNQYIRESIFDANTDLFIPQKGDAIIMKRPYNNSTSQVNIQNASQFMIRKIDNRRTDENGLDLIDVDIQIETPKGLQTITIDALNPNDENFNKYNHYITSKLTEISKLKGKPGYKVALKQFWDYVNSIAVFDYSYAITSHKSQGSTYDAVIVDALDINSVGPVSLVNKARSIYTALTRARNITMVLRQSPSDVNYDLNQLNDRINELKGVNKFTSEDEIDQNCVKICKNPRQ